MKKHLDENNWFECYEEVPLWFLIVVLVFAIMGGPIGIISIIRWITTGIWTYGF